MTRRFKTIINGSSGDGFPLTAAVTLALLMVFLVITQYARLMITASVTFRYRFKIMVWLPE